MASVKVRAVRAVRAYAATAGMGASAGVGEHPVVLLDHGIGLLRMVLLLFVWRAVMGTREVGGLDESSVLTYVLLANVFAEQLDARTTVLESIWNGSVATRLLRPMSVFGDHVAEMVGSWLLRALVFTIPVLLASPLLGISVAPASAARGAAFLLSIVLSVAVGVATDFLFGVLIVRFVQSMWAIRFARDSFTPLLGGAVIPLALLPWHIGAVFEWLPFASMAAAPLRIYVGNGPVLRLLAVQLAWAVVLWVVVRDRWRRAAPRMVSVGG
jgi:ABC-2 type transport system permease protein